MFRSSRLPVMLILVATIGVGWPVETAAQRRAPPGRTTGVAVPRTHAPRYYRPSYSSRYHYPYSYGRFYYPYAFARPYYYAPFYYPYYSSFAFSFGFGWPGPYGGGYGYPYAYPYYWYGNTGSARLVISPRNAEVYVDGRFVGRVDDFDGSLQRLHVENGPHEIKIYLDGHRTFTQKVLFTRGTTVKIAHAMQPLAAGEAAEPKPAPDPVTAEPDRYQGRPMPPSRAGEQADFGTLMVRVTPADAEILIDGEVWDRPGGENRLAIDLAEGPHQIEIRKEGYRPYVRTVDVFRGRTFTLNVSLPLAGPGMVRIDARR